MRAALALVLLLVLGHTMPAAAAEAPTAVTVSPGYYVTAYDGKLWEVQGGAVRTLTSDQWKALGSPAPKPAPTDYVRYAWSGSISAVTFFGPTRDDWVWEYLSWPEYQRAGYPAVRTADWIAGSRFFQYATSSQILVTDPGDVTHVLTWDEWQRAQAPGYERLANTGYMRLSWDTTGSVAYMCDIAAGRGLHVSWAEYQRAGTPAPQVVNRTAGDRVWSWGWPPSAQGTSAVIAYQGPIAELDLTYSQWTTLGSPSPESRLPSKSYSCTPPSGDGVFTIATYPDTQQEVFDWAGTRFLDRSKWLVAQKSALDLRFVTHVGDVVNWDTETHDQYVIAETAMDPLETAAIPYQLAIGNHDSLATGPGGAARDSKRTREYQRTTTTFNQFWSAADYGAVAGAFEQGKVDNVYSTFTAEGADWLVLSLELWPRVAAVDWAASVISSHPRHNVIIHTHSLLDGAANIESAGQSVTRYQYGDSSPQYVYDRLVTPYANVKVVMSGHVGTAASKVVTTPAGNRVAHLLQTFHSNNNNPTRLSEFDVVSGVIRTRVYAPENGYLYDMRTLSGLTFITR